MLIWSRWGILVFGFIGLGIALGFGLGTLTGLTQDGPQMGFVVGIGWVLSGALLRVFDRQVMGRHLDKPQPQFFREPMPEPVIRERGNLQTHRLVPQLDLETGEQVVLRPRSTFFYVPMRFWPFILMGAGALVAALNAGPALAG